MPEQRRASDGLIIEMHGNIQTLLAHQKNAEDDSAEMKQRLNNHGNRIGKIEGSITGLKMIGSAAAIVGSSALAFLGFYKK